MHIVLRAPRVFTAEHPAPILNGCVVIQEERIAEVGPYGSTDIPVGARVIDLEEYTICPGLIDVHSHVSIHTLGNEHSQLARRESEIVLDAAEWLWQDLRSGVTTMRTLGDPHSLDFLFRKKQASGSLRAPRLLVAGNLLRSSLVSVSVAPNPTDDEVGLRRLIRDNLRNGCDWIKFYGTPFSKAEDPVHPAFSREEVETIFLEARAGGRPVSVHCHGGIMADWCIELGVESLEHGVFLEQSQMEAMVGSGITLVPTTGVILLQKPATMTPIIERNRSRASTYLRWVREAGVRCIPGTDAVHGELSFEVLQMVEGGYSPVEGLTAITRDAAELLHCSDTVGTLSAGKLADIVAFHGNPLEDPDALRRVGLVVQAGARVFSDHDWTDG